jgi:hypothetical protein
MVVTTDKLEMVRPEEGKAAVMVRKRGSQIYLEDAMRSLW